MMKKWKLSQLLLLICLLVTFCLPDTMLYAQNLDNSVNADFQMEGTTLIRYIGTERNVTIPANCTEIGKEAFLSNASLETVTIGNQVEKIGNSAFKNCKNLNKVVIGDYVKEIGKSAFCDAVSLKTVTIGSGVEKIREAAFGGCSSLKAVSVVAANQQISCKYGAIYENNGKVLCQVLAGREGETYTMPDTVTEVLPYAFWGCDRVKSVRFSGGLSELTQDIFNNCTGLEYVKIPENIRTIGVRAFANTPNLKEVDIPVSVLSIHDTAFRSAPNVGIFAAEGSVADQFAIAHQIPKLNQLTLDRSYNWTLEKQNEEDSKTDQTVSGNNQSQNGNSDTQKLKENANLDQLQQNEIGASFIVSGKAVVMLDPNKVQVLSGDEYGEGFGDFSIEGAKPELMNEVGFPKYTIFENQIARNAYYQSQITNYVIPEGVTRIGEYAFARSEVREVVLPNTLKSIGRGAFSHCMKLDSITIPDSVEEIEEEAFENTRFRQNWLNGMDTSDFYIVGNGILLFYKGEANQVTIPEGVRQIATGAFKNHSEIRGVSFPDSLEVIGEAAFQNCSNMTTVNGGTNLVKIKDLAFSGCPLETIRIPASVKEVGLGAFNYSLTGRDVGCAVVFMGKTLPQLHYESGATYVEKNDRRACCFKDVETAVLWNRQTRIEDTILADENYGFQGFVCEILEEASSGGYGSLKLLQVNDVQNHSTLPESVWVFGSRYRIVDPDGILEHAKAKASEKSQQDSLVIQNDCAVFAGGFEAKSGTEENYPGYCLQITNDETAEEALVEQCKALCKDQFPSEYQTFTIEMTDEKGQIPITNLWEEPLEITLPVPPGMSSEGLVIATRDFEGQLEQVPFDLYEDANKVMFTASHLSPFVMFQLREHTDTQFKPSQSHEVTQNEGNGQQTNIEESIPMITVVSIFAGSFLLVVALALAFTRMFHKG